LGSFVTESVIRSLAVGNFLNSCTGGPGAVK